MKKLMIFAILLALVMAVVDLTYDAGTEADVVCPMANRHIEWTYFGK